MEMNPLRASKELRKINTKHFKKSRISSRVFMRNFHMKFFNLGSRQRSKREKHVRNIFNSGTSKVYFREQRLL